MKRPLDVKRPLDKRRHDDEKYCCEGMPLDVKRPLGKRRPLDKRRPPAPSGGGDIVKRASASSPRSKLKSSTMDLKGTGRKKKRRDEKKKRDAGA